MHGVAVTSPSTVGEHRNVVIQDCVPANAPGRSEGRCEHHDRAVVRSRDTGHGVCCGRERRENRDHAVVRSRATGHGVCCGRERRDDDDHAVVRSRDTGSGVCTVAPWQTRHSPRRKPRPGANQRRRASCHSRRTCRALRAILAPSPRVTRLSTNQM
jgi:hypothetical protein